MSQWALYEQILQDSVGLYQDSVLRSFYEQKFADNIGKLYAIKQNLALAYDSTNIANLSDSNYYNYQQNYIDQAILINDEISPDILPLAYLKTTTQLFLNSLLPSFIGFDSSEQAQIIYIANLCATLYGPAVLDARALRTMFDNEATYNDNELCFGVAKGTGVNYDELEQINAANTELLYKQSAIVNLKTKAKVYPNPATDEVTITVASLPKNAYITISNSIGHIVKTEKLTDNTTFINTSKILAGIYLLSIFDSQGLYYQTKLSIIK